MLGEQLIVRRNLLRIVLSEPQVWPLVEACERDVVFHARVPPEHLETLVSASLEARAVLMESALVLHEVLSRDEPGDIVPMHVRIPSN